MFRYEPPTSPYLSFIFRDEHIAVMHKPHGLLSVPGKAVEHRDSLHYRLTRVLPSATVVHRLDMATSGIIVLALNKHAHRNISKQFELRQIKKKYVALIHGVPIEKQGSIELPLRCDWPNRPKQMVDHENGKHALTHYQVVDHKVIDHKVVAHKMSDSAKVSHTPEGETRQYSLVELFPVTGRSHQLRVHMQAIGHPILGDRLYAQGDALHSASRLCLHATYISFTHPDSGKQITFNNELSLDAFLM